MLSLLMSSSTISCIGEEIFDEGSTAQDSIFSMIHWNAPCFVDSEAAPRLFKAMLLLPRREFGNIDYRQELVAIGEHSFAMEFFSEFWNPIINQGLL